MDIGSNKCPPQSSASSVYEQAWVTLIMPNVVIWLEETCSVSFSFQKNSRSFSGQSVDSNSRIPTKPKLVLRIWSGSCAKVFPETREIVGILVTRVIPMAWLTKTDMFTSIVGCGGEYSLDYLNLSLAYLFLCFSKCVLKCAG